jgi:predicted nuclease with TOPRIM domain
MSDEQTLPTTQTILDEMRAGFAAVERRLSILETQIENMDIRFDRLEGEVKFLRADFKEFRAQFRQPA